MKLTSVRVEHDRETIEEQRASGRYNPGRMLEFAHKGRKFRVSIGAGTSDEVSVYRSGSTFFVLSENSRMGYVGLERFEDGKRTGEVFSQSEEQITELLGPRGLDYTEPTKVRRLAQYLSY